MGSSFLGSQLSGKFDGVAAGPAGDVLVGNVGEAAMTCDLAQCLWLNRCRTLPRLPPMTPDVPQEPIAPPAADTSADLLAQLAPDVLYAAEQDMWVRETDDGTVLIGATHLVAAHGQFMIFSPRPPGTVVAHDRSLGVMETAKTAVAVHAPLSGEIIEANQAVVDDVSLVARDPYGAGWLIRLRPTALADERSLLRDVGSYATWLGPRLAEKQAKPIDDEFATDLSIDPNHGY
jgi:glycine cleavage system H protein